VLIARGILSRTRTRKVFMAAALLVPAACLVACGRAASPDWAVALMTASIGVSGLASTGFQANYLEISATLSGVIMSVGNTIATLPGMTSPVLTGMILDRYGCSKQDPAACQGAYQVVFYIAFGVQAPPPPRPPSLLLPLPVSLLCTHSLPPEQATGALLFVALASSDRVLS